MSEAVYLVGIDLGTSNSAVAFAELRPGESARVVDFPVPQLQRLGEVAPRALLPSCIYLPGVHELPPDATRLPWEDAPKWIIGEFARWQGSRVPGRLVTSAKSWLCHPGVDRSAPILPWGAPAEVNRISPVDASASLLAHIARAWDFAHPEARLASQDVIITVPASFDEVARALTVNAARKAGLEKFTLLEEPQAAFYDFTARHERDLGRALENVRLVLVVDIGGGTSDFTLVQVGLSPDGPALRRLAVGEHLMLGGDNMDAALGRKVEERMTPGGRKLSTAQWSQLVQTVRLAKESLLGSVSESSSTPLPPSLGATARPRRNAVEAGKELRAKARGTTKPSVAGVSGAHVEGLTKIPVTAQVVGQASRLPAGRLATDPTYAGETPDEAGETPAPLPEQLQIPPPPARGTTALPGSPEHYNISIVAEGSRLVGGSLSAQITRSEAEQLLLDGFFPECEPEAIPRKEARVALQELGLPYAQDPAITRHLAAFLRRHAQAGFTALESRGEGTPGLLPRPDAILLNGGVFNSPRIAERLVNVVSSWWPAAPPIQVLRHDSLELAVARGAAHAGLARRGHGRRIGGGTAHAFFVGLAQSGSEAPLALCIIPRGHEEGEAVDLGERIFQLTLGRPVQFPLYSTTADRIEKAGEVVPVTEDLHLLPPIHTLLKGTGGKTGQAPVHLRALLTEIGTLELWCVSNENNNERWRLEFELRGNISENSGTVVEPMPPRFEEARQWIERIFGHKPPPAHRHTEAKGAPPKDVKQLWSSVEKTLGPRETWRVPVLRELWSGLFAGAARRRRSAEHERIFFQMTGYTLRPGFGYPLDDWRCEQMFGLFPESVQFHQEKVGWIEFWILWRRIAGGLSEAHHVEIWNFLKPHLAQRLPTQASKNMARPKGIQPEGLEEMVRLAAALEHLPPEEKSQLGDWIVARLREPGANAGGPWAWSLGRLGARLPIYGSIHKTVAPEKVTEWVSLLLEPQWAKAEGALFAISQLARLTADRARDLNEETRTRVLAALKAGEASPSWERMVAEVVALETADKARALGDTMPVGLQL